MDALWRDLQAVLATHGGAADRAARSSWLPDTVDVTARYRVRGEPIHLIGVEFSRQTRNVTAFEAADG